MNWVTEGEPCILTVHVNLLFLSEVIHIVVSVSYLPTVVSDLQSVLDTNPTKACCRTLGGAVGSDI